MARHNMPIESPTQSSTGTRSLQELSGAVVKQLVAGRPQETVVKQLVQRGWPEVSARHFVANAAQAASQHREENDEERAYIAELFRRRMLRDLVLTVICCGATFVLYDFAHTMPALPLFFLSMTVFSLVDLITALVGWWRYRK